MRPPRPLLLLLLAACGAEPPARPGGVVSLLPSWTEIVVGLGEGGRLAGCTDACEPGREVARVPWQGTQAAEAILRLRPALVVRQAPRAEADALADALRGGGVELLSLPSETVEDVRRAILAIGEALGATARAGEYLARFDRDLARARAKGEGRGEPRVLFVFGRDAGAVANVDAAGPGTFLDELIRYAGGRNALEGVGTPYPRVRLETVVRLAPDVIIDNVPEGTDPLAAWEEFRTIPAVRDGRVHAVRDRDLLIPGPRLPRSVERLAGLIHGRP